jgi:inosine-uridine nucleoside N-ribohydrolase
MYRHDKRANSATRFGHSPLRYTLLVVTVIALLLPPVTASAQTPNSFWIPPFGVVNSGALAEASTTSTAPSSLIIDTDTGVDDAIALAWLLSHVQPQKVLGIVTVAGNTTVENATNNVLTVLDKVQPSTPIPVVIGASKPLSQKLSATGKLIHGQDGLWGKQIVHPLNSLPKDARKFYCANAKQPSNAGATILALGPLTNIAGAIRQCGNDMRSYSRIVILGGAKVGGNATPVAEFNFWQDPEAAQIVLKSGMKIDMVTLDAFSQLTFSIQEIFGIAQSGPAVYQYLLPALLIYAGTQLGAGAPAASIPDLVAAIYTLNGFGNPAPALVNVVDSPDPVRGQSIIGILPSERATMIADDKEQSNIVNEAFARSNDPVLPDIDYINAKFGEILSRVPNNANVVREIDEVGMHNFFLQNLAIVSGAPDAPADQHLYLPSINGD